MAAPRKFVSNPMATIQPTIVSTVVVSDSSGQFKVNAAQYYDATTVLQVTLNQAPTSVSIAGWSVTINGTPDPGITLDSVDGTEIYIQTLVVMGAADTVRVQYDPATGDTVADSAPLAAYDGVAVGVPPALVWSAGGSAAYITDGLLQQQRFLPQASGVGTPQFNNPANLILPDFQGLYREIPTGSAPVWGSRQVTNLVIHSNNPGILPWTTQLTTTIVGNLITFGEQYSNVRQVIVGKFRIGDLVRVSMDITLVSGNANLDLVAENTTSSPSVPVTVSTTKARYSMLVTTTAVDLVIGLQDRNVAGQGSVILENVQCENVTGQANQNPSTYIYTTTAEVTQFWCNENGNTVTPALEVIPGDGPVLTDQPWFYCAPAVTNAILQSYNLAAAAWIKRGSGTAVLDAVGLTGAPNTASTVSVSEVNGGDVYQDLAGLTPDAPCGLAVRMKAITTTGLLSIRNSAGPALGSWNLDMSLLSTAEWNVVTDTHPAVTVVTPFANSPTGAGGVHFHPEPGAPQTITFIVGGVDYYDNVASANGFAPIPTAAAAVTNAATDMRFSIANHADDQGAYFAEIRSANGQAAIGTNDFGIVSLAAPGQDWACQDGASWTFWTEQGIAQIGVAIQPGVVFKGAVVYDASENLKSINVNGTYGTEVPYVSWLDTYNYIRVGQAGTPVLIRNVRRYNLPYAEAKARIDSLMA